MLLISARNVKKNDADKLEISYKFQSDWDVKVQNIWNLGAKFLQYVPLMDLYSSSFCVFDQFVRLDNSPNQLIEG